jgi:hypothetical protein
MRFSLRTITSGARNFHQLLETIVAIDDASIEIVQV